MEQARGRWPGLLPHFGVPAKSLNGKHHPCPNCGGKDRFRFLNTGGNGTYICNQCGNGNGIGLVMKVKGWDFRTAAQELRKLVDVTPRQSVAKATNEVSLHVIRGLWEETVALPGTQGAAYFAARGLPGADSEQLRFHPNCPLSEVPGHKNAPAVIALVRDAKGKPCGLTRLYLDGDQKAAWRDEEGKVMANRRFLGGFPKSCAVRLSKPHTGVLGVAEGYETALACTAITGILTWALLNTSIMESFVPPRSVRRLVVFGDNDSKFGGQKAAYTLAHKTAVIKDGAPEVQVRLPDTIGWDWLNVHNGK